MPFVLEIGHIVTDRACKFDNEQVHLISKSDLSGTSICSTACIDKAIRAFDIARDAIWKILMKWP